MGLSEHGRTYALFAITVVSASLGNLSQTALNVMMVTVTDEFGVSIAVGQWLTTIYMLMLGIVVPITTFLDQRLSDRGYVLISLAFFFAGALLDAVASSFSALFLGRVLQAISTGLLVPSTQNIAMRCFPAGRQGTAMGISGIAMGFAPNIGPTIGSWFVAGIGWRWFFGMLMLFSVAGAIITLATVPAGKAQIVRIKLGLGSFVLSAVAFGGLLTGLSCASSEGLASPLTWLPTVAGAAMLWLFVRREKRIDNPLINMGIFASRRYGVGFWAQNLLFGSFMGITLIIPLYIENLCGGTAAQAGAVLLPAAIVALIFNPLGGKLADKMGNRRVLLISTIFLVVGAALFIGFDESTPIWWVATCQTIRAIGISTSISPLITWMLYGLPEPLISHGSSFAVLVRQACASLGTAVMIFFIEVMPAWGASPAWGFSAAFGFSAAVSTGTLLMAWVSMRSAERAEERQAQIRASAEAPVRDGGAQ